MVLPGSMLAALSITYFTPCMRLYASPPSPLLYSVIVCHQSIAVTPSSAAAPPRSRNRWPPLLYSAANCLPSPTATVAQCRRLPAVFPVTINQCRHRPTQLLTARCTSSYSEVYSVYLQGPFIQKFGDGAELKAGMLEPSKTGTCVK